MSDKTPRLDLETFDVGDKPPWDHTDTVEATDQYAIVHGPIADRPDTGEYDDELYHAVDQNITWRWDQDAADWEYFAGQGSADQPVPGDSYYNGLLAGGLGGINDEPLPLTSDVNGGGDRSLTDLEKVGTEALEAEDITGVEEIEASDATVDSVTSNSATVEGTATVDALEAERGSIGNVQITPENADSISTHKGDQVTVEADDTETIFSFDEPVDVIGGALYGGDIQRLNYVVGGDVVRINGSGRSRGRDISGTDFESLPVPPAKDVTEITFQNGSGVQDYTYGWVVNTV